MGTKVHKVIISFHSQDVTYREQLENILSASGIGVVKSVPDGKYDGLPTETIIQKIRDEHISDSTVTVVLIGKDTWRRKYIDWEIHATIRDTPHSPRGGLLGIILPTYPLYQQKQYDPHTVPPRLYDNVKKGYAELRNWTTDPALIQNYIDIAFKKRDDIHNLPDSSYTLFAENRNSGERWQ